MLDTKAEPDQTDSAQPVVDSIERPNRLPPISILDLLVLTTALAFVYMILDRLLGGQPELSQFAESTIWNVWRMVSAVLPGVAFASIFWIVKQKRITGKFLWEPGHWILVAYAVLQVVLLSASLVLLNGDDPALVIHQYLLAIGLANVAVGIIVMVAVFCNPLRWRGVLLIVSISMFIAGIVHLSMLADLPEIRRLVQVISFVKIGVDMLCVPLLIAATITDIKKNTRRDWLHWVGVFVLFLAFVVQPVGEYFLIRFLFVGP